MNIAVILKRSRVPIYLLIRLRKVFHVRNVIIKLSVIHLCDYIIKLKSTVISINVPSVKRHSQIDITLIHTCKYIQVLNHFSVSVVKRLSQRNITLKDTCKYILLINPLSVTSVKRPSQRNMALIITCRYILEKNHLSVTQHFRT